ncbi:MAG: methyltransferase domain-containing protein [Chloroflexota bacterium]|nr:MAG: methyltransferase domain-containing protein [Chloroflexota bacterium]
MDGAHEIYPQATSRLPLHMRILVRFLRIFFKYLYHQMAWTYDGVAAIVSLGKWKQWVLAVLPRLSGPYILELGHGPGHLQAALLERQPSLEFVAGLDRSHQMGRQARKRLLRGGLQPSLVNGTAFQLPFPSNTFNQVVATFPTDYIAHPLAIAEVMRVLSPGGSLIVVPVAWITGRRPEERLAALLFRVTSQAPPYNKTTRYDRALEPLVKAGFQARAELVHLPASTILVLEATKPA